LALNSAGSFGLALSSRNQYLTPEQKSRRRYCIAACSGDLFPGWGTSGRALVEVVKSELAINESVASVALEYVELVDPDYVAAFGKSRR